MGSRTLPVDCPHGYTIDWGDFGPTCPLAQAAGEDYPEYCLDPENCESCYKKCPDCEAARAKREAESDRLLHQVELTLERSRRWRRRFVADHGPGYEDDETFRLVRDLDNALRAATREEAMTLTDANTMTVTLVGREEYHRLIAEAAEIDEARRIFGQWKRDEIDCKAAFRSLARVLDLEPDDG